MKDMSISTPASLGQALRAARSEAKLTQTEVGSKVGVDQSTISSVENGNPGTRLDTLFHLLAALNLELSVRSRAGRGDAGKERW